jgi:Integrase core domain
MRRWDLLSSFGTIGDCFDNAAMESFWARMQVELLNTRKWATSIERAAAMADYIDNFYNAERRHSYLGNISPTTASNGGSKAWSVGLDLKGAGPSTHCAGIAAAQNSIHLHCDRVASRTVLNLEELRGHPQLYFGMALLGVVDEYAHHARSTCVGVCRESDVVRGGTFSHGDPLPRFATLAVGLRAIHCEVLGVSLRRRWTSQRQCGEPGRCRQRCCCRGCFQCSRRMAHVHVLPNAVWVRNPI